MSKDQLILSIKSEGVELSM